MVATAPVEPAYKISTLNLTERNMCTVVLLGLALEAAEWKTRRVIPVGY